MTSDRNDNGSSTCGGGGGGNSHAMPTRETGGLPENFMSKKTAFDGGKVWLEAFSDFENELHEHVEQPGKEDQLKFQVGRLERALKRRIKARASSADADVLAWLIFARSSAGKGVCFKRWTKASGLRAVADFCAISKDDLRECANYDAADNAICNPDKIRDASRRVERDFKRRSGRCGRSPSGRRRVPLRGRTPPRARA